MDATTVIAVAGLIVAGLLGPSVTAWWNQRRQRDQQEHERRLRDLDELRRVLDDCAAAIEQMSVTGNRYLELQSRETATAEAEAQARAARADAWGTLSRERARLRIRLGEDHSAVKPFENASQALRDLMFGPASVAEEEGWPPVDELIGRYEHSRQEFIAEAQSLVGARLPPAAGVQLVRRRP